MLENVCMNNILHLAFFLFFREIILRLYRLTWHLKSEFCFLLCWPDVELWNAGLIAFLLRGITPFLGQTETRKSHGLVQNKYSIQANHNATFLFQLPPFTVSYLCVKHVTCFLVSNNIAFSNIGNAIIKMIFHDILYSMSKANAQP